MKIDTVRKALVGLVAAIAILINRGVIPSDVQVYVDAVIAVLLPLGIYRIPNADSDVASPEGAPAL